MAMMCVRSEVAILLAVGGEIKLKRSVQPRAKAFPARLYFRVASSVRTQK